MASWNNPLSAAKNVVSGVYGNNKPIVTTALKGAGYLLAPGATYIADQAGIGNFRDATNPYTTQKGATTTSGGSTTTGSSFNPNIPYAPEGSSQIGGGGSGYGSGGGGSIDWASIAEAQDLLSQSQNLMDRLPGQRDVFNTNLANTYRNYRTGLETDFGRNQAAYQDNRTSTINDQINAKTRIDGQVRQRANSLQRLLGAAGAGDSEAARTLAPYAAARTGTQLRNQVNQTYGKNLQGLDQSFGNYKADYDNSLVSLADEEANKKRAFESDYLQKQFEAQDNIRKANSAIDYARTGNAQSAQAIRQQSLPALFALLQQIDALGQQQITPTAQQANYNAPDLEQYTTENAGNVGGVDASVQGDVSPYYQWLLRKQEEDQNTFGY